MALAQKAESRDPIPDSQPPVWQVLAAIAIGCLTIGAVIWLVFFTGELKPFQENVAWALLALGIAGAAAVLPGFLNVNIPKVASAGGAFAVFVLVYTQSPMGQSVIARIIEHRPVGDPRATASAYLDLVDKGEYATAYTTASKWLRNRYSENNFLELSESVRKPLGAAIHRSPYGERALDNPSGLPPGTYQEIGYRTQYGNAQYIDSVLVGAEKENGIWEVYGYTITPFPSK